MADKHLIKPSYATQHAASSAIATRRAAPTASRSWCATATPISAMCARRAFRSSTCATRRSRRRSTISRTRPTPGACTFRCMTTSCSWSMGRDMFSQPEMADERNYYKPKSGTHGHDEGRERAQLVGRHGRVRHLEAGRAAADRLHARRRHGAPPHLVCRRSLGLRLGDDGGVQRLHSHHHRHAGSDEAAHRRPLLACRE